MSVKKVHSLLVMLTSSKFQYLLKRFLTVASVSASLFYFSCNQPVKTYDNNLGIRPVVLAQIDSANYTLISWKDSVQNFGTLTQGDSLKIKFRFENTGKTGLFFIEARPSCGCTNVQYPEDIIMPGSQGELTASFASSGQQTGTVYKTIFVKTNTLNSMRHTLVFKGEIKKKGI